MRRWVNPLFCNSSLTSWLTTDLTRASKLVVPTVTNTSLFASSPLSSIHATPIFCLSLGIWGFIYTSSRIIRNRKQQKFRFVNSQSTKLLKKKRKQLKGLSISGDSSDTNLMGNESTDWSKRADPIILLWDVLRERERDGVEYINNSFCFGTENAQMIQFRI